MIVCWFVSRSAILWLLSSVWTQRWFYSPNGHCGSQTAPWALDRRATRRSHRVREWKSFQLSRNPAKGGDVTGQNHSGLVCNRHINLKEENMGQTRLYSKLSHWSKAHFELNNGYYVRWTPPAGWNTYCIQLLQTADPMLDWTSLRRRLRHTAGSDLVLPPCPCLGIYLNSWDLGLSAETQECSETPSCYIIVALIRLCLKHVSALTLVPTLPVNLITVWLRNTRETVLSFCPLSCFFYQSLSVVSGHKILKLRESLALLSTCQRVKRALEGREHN